MTFNTRHTTPIYIEAGKVNCDTLGLSRGEHPKFQVTNIIFIFFFSPFISNRANVASLLPNSHPRGPRTYSNWIFKDPVRRDDGL